MRGKDWFWDRYWHADRVASCFDRDTRNYPLDFKKEWHDFLATLPGAAKILDLCTGNGAVARIAAEYAVATDRDFSITGVDQANIKPEEFVSPTTGQELIDFKGGIPAEDLPFEDNAFDAVVSQYGFEYTQKDAVAKKLSMVLKPEGAGKLICHAAEGAPARAGAKEVEKVKFLAEEIALFDAAKEATEAIWLLEKGPPEQAQTLATLAQEKLEAYKAGMQRLIENLKQNPKDPFLYNTYGLLRHTFVVRAHFPLEDLIEKIEEVRTEALAHQSRIEALMDASLSEQDCRALKVILEGSGLSDVTFEPVYLEEGAKMVGWNFEFTCLAK